MKKARLALVLAWGMIRSLSKRENRAVFFLGTFEVLGLIAVLSWIGRSFPGPAWYTKANLFEEVLVGIALTSLVASFVEQGIHLRKQGVKVV